MGGVKNFRFGREVSPKWFLDKVDSKDIEYVMVGRKVIACRFYDTWGQERVIAVGEVVTSDMLYR